MKTKVKIGELIDIALVVTNMFLHSFDNATIRWGDTIRNPKVLEGDALMRFDMLSQIRRFRWINGGK